MADALLEVRAVSYTHLDVYKRQQDKGFKNVVIVTPNYPGGKDAVAGFKRYYKGKVAEEIYTKLGQLDYAAELAQVRSYKPDALFFFLPGGMGINFVKQFVAAGLSRDTQPVSYTHLDVYKRQGWRRAGDWRCPRRWRSLPSEIRG